jgi:5-methyltetrahydrofolate--homocysteine methyltransferase
VLIVGELINSTRKSIADAITKKDALYIQEIARRQVESGAQIIDVNAATSECEVESIKWLVDTIQQAVEVPLCIDSPSAEALAAGLARCRRTAMVNSISAEQKRWSEILPVVKQYHPRVVALCMDDGGLPKTSADRLRIGGTLIEELAAAGVPADDIFLDPLVKPAGVNTGFGLEFLESTYILKKEYPQAHCICGLSNVSFGLPNRQLLNRTFMVMAMAAGMDAFILNPLDNKTMSLFHAAKLLTGQDEYCLDYINVVRSGGLEA